MKNSFLYAALIVLVLAVIAVGYNNYARKQTVDETTVTSEETVVVGDTADAAAAGTDIEENVVDETVVIDNSADTDTAALDEAAPAPEAGSETATPVETGPATGAAIVAATDAADEASPAADANANADAVTPATDDQSLLAPPADLQINIAEMMVDHVLGDANAPVTIVEYASYTCAHCAKFANEVLPLVKAQLIDTGKAKLILREFPLDKFALQASKLARCAPGDRYHDLAEVLFRNQERWIKAEDPVRALKQLGSLTGMDEDQMDACLNSTELENAIVQRMQDAQGRYKINSTPTFVFNDGAESFAGAQTIERFVETVDKLSQ